ncbi:YCF48-related protein [Winogradskyella sp.]|uniref:YCF48-related protein n=1 Tax=Winogradskyella sp. TaxID=1883156 RepID=UPI0026206165|nr:YCF48-related protein [Winogradskyella sp.]
MKTKYFSQLVPKTFNLSIINLYSAFALLGLVCQETFAQNSWELSFPSETRNGRFFIKSPQGSNNFYLFGHDVKALNSVTQELSDMPNLPLDVLYKEVPTGISAPYRHMDIFTLDDNKWWMVHKGRILKTTNAGADWLEVLSLNPNTQYVSSSYFTSIHFPTENVGYAVGTAEKLFKTTDGGDTWIELQWSNSTAPYIRYSSVKFINELEGFAMGYEVDDILLNIGVYRPFLRRTNDGGQTWTEISFAESDHHYVDIQIAGLSWYLMLRNRNFVAPADRIRRTINNGTNWSTLDLPGLTPSTSLVIRDMHWFSAEEGVILGTKDIFDEEHSIYKTYNSGATWVEIPIDQGTIPFFARVPSLVMSFNGSNGLISGATGNILFSSDKGETWQSLQKGYPDITDMSSDNGITYAALYGQSLLKHNGSNWQELDIPFNSQYQYPGAYRKIDNDGTEVALIDIFGELQYSNDGGNNWSSLFTDLEKKALDVHFHNGQLTALIYDTDLDALLYYPNAQNEQSFEMIEGGTPLPASVFDLFFVEQDIFARVESFLFKRTNGTWQQIFLNDGFIRGMLMDEEGNAVMKFSDNKYYYSNDSAETWEESAFSSSIMDKVDFEISTISGFGKLDDNMHYAIVHGSPDFSQRFETYLIVSNDNGASWDLEESALFGEPQNLGGIGHTIDDEGNLWVGSANAAIFKWNNGALSIPEIPGNELFTIYPNPTSGKVNVRSSQSIDSYELYTIQGQLISSGALDINGSLELGAQYPSGIYLMRLIDVNGSKSSFKIIKK